MRLHDGFVDAINVTANLSCCGSDIRSSAIMSTAVTTAIFSSITDGLVPNAVDAGDGGVLAGSDGGLSSEEEEGGGEGGNGDGEKMISDEMRKVLEIVFFVVLSGGISIFGCVGNVINMVVFWKQVS